VVSMCSCSAWCMIARRVYKPNICRLLMLHCLWKHGCQPEFPCFKHFLAFACLWEHGWRLRCTHTMRSLTCVSVVVCVTCKLRPCPSYSRRRDRINLVLCRRDHINLVPNLNSGPNVVQPRGVWGLAHVFDGKLYFTRDHMKATSFRRTWRCLSP
jgi:hypothetical protein